MAGGIGSRFWPVSTVKKPKQFLDILGVGSSLLQLTYQRFAKICPPENILVVTSMEYEALVAEQLPDIPKENILGEPLRRNTAPCINYATFRIANMTNNNANIVVTPADHLIIDEQEFLKNINDGLEFVKKKEALLTLGIKPTRPDTGYGYIQMNNPGKAIGPFKPVKTFTEKPNNKMAKFFVESGEFTWNSGIFLWSLTTIQKALAKYIPEVYGLFAEGRKIFGTKEEKEFIHKVYSESKNISIDYGVMEKAEYVYTLPTNFGWSDLGTWKSLYENITKDENDNVITGTDYVLTSNVQGCIVHAPDEKIVVINDLEDYIIVDSGHALLISRQDKEQEIKETVNEVKRKFGEDKV